MNATSGERRAARRAACQAASGARGDVRRGAFRLAWLTALVLAPAVARAQGAPPPAKQPPTQPAPKRRALEIRGQAPAPEVVTVRPREVPVYTRRILVPALFDARPSTPAPQTVVLLPGPPPASRVGGSRDPVKPPE